MNSFVDKLRMDNLYPSVPTESEGPSVFDQFHGLMSSDPIIHDRLAALGTQHLMNSNSPVQQPQMTNQMAGDGRPGNTSPNVNYKPPVTDRMGGDILGIEADPATAYQKGELANRQADLALKKQALGEKTTNDQNRIGISKQRADAYDFKTRNPNLKFQINKSTGELEAIDPVKGTVVNNLGKTQLGEEELIGLNQSNKIAAIDETGKNQLANTTQQGKQAETLAELKARQEMELANFNNQNKPTGGNTDVEVVRDKSGNVTGVKTKKSNTYGSSTILMYGKDGKAYHIGSDKIDQAKKDGFTDTKPVGK